MSHFQDLFSKKTIAIDAALGCIESNMRVVAAMAAAEPTLLMQGLADRAESLSGLQVHCANPTADYECFSRPSLTGKVLFRVMFLTSAVRRHQGHQRVHYVPQHLSKWVENLDRNGTIDVFWGSCTPPDERGFVSLGPNACYEPEILRRAKKVILEVNDQLPMTWGSTHVPLDLVDHFVVNHHPLPTVPAPTIEAEDRKIGEYVAALVEDGSTIQLGIGAIPNAIGEALADKRDLGIHTEMINDTMMALARSGVVNGRRKTIWPGKIVGAFAYGSRELYDFIDGNPMVELQPASVVNDPYRIGRNARMVSINTAVEIDVTGQVCSESVGHRELSGVGGASETHIGAQRSPGGRGIIAFRSLTPKGHSKIAFELQPGAKVSISRNDIDTVVTEYGVAELAGRSVADRVEAMARVAHPSVRDELLTKAKEAGYL